MTTVQGTIACQARRVPATAAMRIEDHSISYGELELASNRTARALTTAGLGAGDRVAYLGREAVHYYDLFVACAKTAAVLVPVNWRLTAPEVRHIMGDSGASVLFVESEFRRAADELPGVRIIDVGGADGAGLAEFRVAADDSPVPDPGTGPDDAVLQLYTSGTTGLPKGVVLAHRMFFAARDAMAAGGVSWIDMLPGDVSLIGVPGFHVGGIWLAMQGFGAGITNVAMRAWNSRDALELIRTEGVTIAGMVPAMLQMLLAEPSATPADFTRLRKVIYGGSPISETLLRRCIDTMGCEFAQIYGLTETGNTAVCLPPDQHFAGSPRLQAAGRPYPGFEAKAIGSDGESLAPGQIGEICLRTPARMLEYWGLPEATAGTLVDGWVHTGDAGYLDEEGYVFIRDRIKDVVIVAGENVFPVEIEQVLTRHPAVVEAAVLGVPDERWGEAVHACVVRREGMPVTARELLTFLRGQIADFKMPSSIEFTGSLPRNPSGKVLRRVLRERFWRDMSRNVN
jgi:acyl-CoA synthetase (AMP-forming)/AMP-acid ligase II